MGHLRARGSGSGRWLLARSPISPLDGSISRSSTAGIYVLCVVLLLCVLPLRGTNDWEGLSAALALQALVGGLLTLGGPALRERSHLVAVLGIAAYLASIALLRDVVGSFAGLGALVLLPVIWASVRGEAAEAAIAVAGIALVYLVPMVLIGAPEYPSGNARAALLYVGVSTTIAVIVVRLVRRIESLLQNLSRVADTDQLTGLPNRRAWESAFERELALARRSGRPLTVGLIDLDNFKEYNDTHGHLRADLVLRAVAAAWPVALRESDLLARWGGDEFGLLLPDCRRADAEVLIERLRSAAPATSFSCGLAQFTGEGDAHGVLAAADRDLYRSKREAPEAREPRTGSAWAR